MTVVEPVFYDKEGSRLDALKSLPPAARSLRDARCRTTEECAAMPAPFATRFILRGGEDVAARVGAAFGVDAADSSAAPRPPRDRAPRCGSGRTNGC